MAVLGQAQYPAMLLLLFAFEMPSGAQATLSQGVDASSVLSMMNNWVMILGILVSCLLSGSIINFANELRRSKRMESRIREHETSIDGKMKVFSDQYSLALLKPPELILQESLRQARNDFEPRVDIVRRTVEMQIQDFEKRIERLEESLKTTENRLIQVLVDQRRLPE